MHTTTESGVVVDVVSPVVCGQTTNIPGYITNRTNVANPYTTFIDLYESTVFPRNVNSLNRNSNLDKLISEAEKKKKCHRRAVFYYNVWFYLDAAIGLLLGFAATVIGLLIGMYSAKESPDTELIQWLGFANAVIALVATLIISIFVAFEIPSKTGAFKKSYVEYRDLVTRLGLHQYDDTDIDDIVSWYLKKVLKIEERNKHPLPWFMMVAD